MKKLVVVLGLFLSMASYAEEQSNVINAVSSVVSGVVSTGKDVLKGVKEGIDTGRKEGTSIDNSIGSVGNFVSRTIITGGQSSKVAHFLYGFSAGFGVCGGGGGGAHA